MVDERRVLELPQFAGNAMDLVHLAPGTINGTNLRLRKAGFNNAPSTFSTDGGGNNQNEFSIDGVSNTYSDGTAAARGLLAAAVRHQRIQDSDLDLRRRARPHHGQHRERVHQVRHQQVARRSA